MPGIGKGLQMHPEAQGCVETGMCLLCSNCQNHTEGTFLLPKSHFSASLSSQQNWLPALTGLCSSKNGGGEGWENPVLPHCRVPPPGSLISWALPWLLMGCISCHPTVSSSTIGHQELSLLVMLASARLRLIQPGMLLRSWQRRKTCTTAQRFPICFKSKIPLACKEDADKLVSLFSRQHPVFTLLAPHQGARSVPKQGERTMSPMSKEPHSFLKALMLCMPHKLLQALATLGLQFAEEEESDLKENLDSVKI